LRLFFSDLWPTPLHQTIDNTKINITSRAKKKKKKQQNSRRRNRTNLPIDVAPPALESLAVLALLQTSPTTNRIESHPNIKEHQ
jgi:hypothetical protein